MKRAANTPVKRSSQNGADDTPAMTQGSSRHAVRRISDAMVAAGIRTPSELARMISLPRQTVHRWLSEGIGNINYKNLLKLSDALNVNARWIMYGEIGRIKLPIKDAHEGEAANIARQLSTDLRSQWFALGRNLLELDQVRRKKQSPARSTKRSGPKKIRESLERS
jgi:transcriptional regulator with XRE-family HTH domain